MTGEARGGGEPAGAEGGASPPPGPRPWAAGFRSLEAEHDYEVPVDGRVPPSLRGTLYRNGSGRNELAGAWFPHWFDGDGMVSAIRFHDAGIGYINRFVRTESYLDETRAGRIRHRGFGKMRPGGVLANAFRYPANVANTSVIDLGERLFALWEGGPPVELDPASLATLGPETFGGRVRAFSAHPKRDPATGEVFNFGIDYGRRCTLTAYRIDWRGDLTCYPPVTLPDPVMNHDFVLTEHHLVFCLGPILVHPLTMLLGFASFDGALEWDGGRPTRILVLRRDGAGPPRFIETDPFFQFHFANGYEDGDCLVVDMARYPDYRTIGAALRGFWRSDWPAEGMAALVRLRIDLTTGRVATETFEAGSANEFPRIDPRRVARRHRYAYIACNPPGVVDGLQQRITRIDLDGGPAVAHDFGPGGYPGEPVFIPASADGPEDEGTVVTVVFDAGDGRSRIVGLDARDLAAAPLFVAPLRHHVPFSLHGTFVPAVGRAG